jgi:hypothetical protein
VIPGNVVVPRYCEGYEVAASRVLSLSCFLHSYVTVVTTRLAACRLLSLLIYLYVKS